jgi:hypothetical protein
MTIDTRYEKCPYCSSAVKRDILHSGNSCGLRQWSDLYIAAPMYFESEIVTRCPNCKKFVWDEEYQPYENEQNKMLDDTKYVIPLKEEDCTYALQTLSLSPMKEESLRIKYWHSNNHKRRDFTEEKERVDNQRISMSNTIKRFSMKEEKYRDDIAYLKRELLLLDEDERTRYDYGPYPYSNDEVINLKRLLELFSQYGEYNERRSYLRAEILRELSLFSECLGYCTSNFDKYKLYIQNIKQMAFEENPFVSEILFTESN